MYSTLSPTTTETSSPQWLIPAEPPIGTGPATWYAALTLGVDSAQDKAYTALAWLLRRLGRLHHMGTPKANPSADEVLLVPSTDELAVAVADTAVALFVMTGTFTQDQAEAFATSDVESLLVPVYVPDDVISPKAEVMSRWGVASPKSYAWFWEETAAAGGPAPRQGMLRADSESDAFARLREALPELGNIKWIPKRAYQNFPLGMETAI